MKRFIASAAVFPTSLAAVVVGLAILVASCVTTEKLDVPNQDVYVPLSNGTVMRIPKGHLNPENKDRTWKDKEGFQRWLMEMRERIQKQRSDSRRQA